MHPIERKIAVATGRGDFIANGCYGKVYSHGENRVFKVGQLDGTAVWLERCFEVQKRLGINHPLCEFMPEIFSFRITNKRTSTGVPYYEAVMAKYQRIREYAHPDHDPYPGLPRYNDIPQDWNSKLTDAGEEVRTRLISQVRDVIGKFGNDLHAGNILWDRANSRWVVVDPSYSGYSCVKKGSELSPKFRRAKRVVTQHGLQRRQ